MSQNKLVFTVFLIILLAAPVFADVPPVRTHRPDVPYFLAPMYFQTVQMMIFPAEISGMVVDSYSDLIWNPAFILRQSGKSAYLDFNPQNNSSSFSSPDFTQYNNYYNSYTDALIQPRWYPATSLNNVKTTPVYNFAVIVPLSSKITMSLMNRSILDYGPYRTSYDWRYFGNALPEGSAASDVQRLDIDENQQTVWGTQSEINLGYNISEKVDLGFRLGHYVYNRDGNLFDSKEGVYPHSSFDNLNDEAFEINGHHFELGIGFVYRLTNKTRLGFYGGLSTGKSKEAALTEDSSETWYERDTNSNYYSDYQYSLESQESYSGNGVRPNMALTFEYDISTSLKFRSFLSYAWSNMDISGSITSLDMVSEDKAYEHYLNSAYHFRQLEFQSYRESELSGTGKNRTNHWNWFASLTYAQNKTWSLFAGIQIQRYSFQQELRENSDYVENSQREYSIFLPSNEEYLHSYEKIYDFETDYYRWFVFLPVGIKINVLKNFYIILGADISLTLVDQESMGSVLYPSRITQRWLDGSMTVNDGETNRKEEYRSTPAKRFDQSLGYRFGIVYEHSSGIKLFIKSLSNILNMANWTFGFEFNW